MKLSNDPNLLKKALKLAAEMIAEHSQLYDELNTPEKWLEELVRRATIGEAPSFHDRLAQGTYSFA